MALDAIPARSELCEGFLSRHVPTFTA